MDGNAQGVQLSPQEQEQLSQSIRFLVTELRRPAEQVPQQAVVVKHHLMTLITVLTQVIPPNAGQDFVQLRQIIEDIDANLLTRAFIAIKTSSFLSDRANQAANTAINFLTGQGLRREVILGRQPIRSDTIDQASAMLFSILAHLCHEILTAYLTNQERGILYTEAVSMANLCDRANNGFTDHDITELYLQNISDSQRRAFNVLKAITFLVLLLVMIILGVLISALYTFTSISLVDSSSTDAISAGLTPTGFVIPGGGNILLFCLIVVGFSCCTFGIGYYALRDLILNRSVRQFYDRRGEGLLTRLLAEKGLSGLDSKVINNVHILYTMTESYLASIRIAGNRINRLSVLNMTYQDHQDHLVAREMPIDYHFIRALSRVFAVLSHMSGKKNMKSFRSQGAYGDSSSGGSSSSSSSYGGSSNAVDSINSSERDYLFSRII